MVTAPCALSQPNQQWAFLKDGTIRNNAIAATNSWCLGSTLGGPGVNNVSGYWLSPIWCDNTTAGGTIWTAAANPL